MLPTKPNRRGRPRKAYDAITITADEYFRQFSELSLSEREKKSLEGVTKWELITIKVLLKLDFPTLSKLLNVTERAIYSYHPDEVISPIISDKILGIIEVYSYGYFIIGNINVRCDWMLNPNPRLNNQPPVDVLCTHSGLLEVRSLLTEMLTGQYH
ncbi:MbcA/ParS/Xre antitoxin family protein [Chitinophaga pollutisoli]|uniref:MbcA/ParS/Xre antitoxin family protein n=1 Tax=Chitinophaga pollutisoli TaxID=3133966 RepID=A0ABZ2YPX0_9BACT